MELIAITESGAPERPIADLPELAIGAMSSTASLYQRSGFDRPWVGYLAVVDGACVGTCAFKSPPENRRVEIAYHTFPEHEGRGLATAMAASLLAIAREVDPGLRVFARTLPEPSASTRVLEKSGFHRIREIEDEDDGPVWEWELTMVVAHKHSSKHREELMRSEVCGCFHCGAVFAPSQIKEWIGKVTAVCPNCGNDSVIGSDSGYAITAEFLDQMREYWFS